MKFLKDMIAKKVSAVEFDEWSDQERDEQTISDWELEADDDVIEDENPVTDAPALAEELAPIEFEPVAEEARECTLPQDGANGSDQEDTAIKIWEMFDDEEDEVEHDAPEAKPPAEEDSAMESSGDLAREALKSMIGPPPVVEKTAPPAAARQSDAATPPNAAVPTDDGQPAQRAGRVKTRMLGFHNADDAGPQQVFDRAKTKDAHENDRFPVGWLVVIEGPGRGTPFALHYGVSTIGRATDQTVSLRFGDNSISRDRHAVLAYDEDSNTFYIGQTGKANLVRLNGRPVLSTEEIDNFDLIRIGETTLRFVGFCGPEFAWDMTDDEEFVHAQAS